MRKDQTEQQGWALTSIVTVNYVSLAQWCRMLLACHLNGGHSSHAYDKVNVLYLYFVLLSRAVDSSPIFELSGSEKIEDSELEKIV